MRLRFRDVLGSASWLGNVGQLEANPLGGIGGGNLWLVVFRVQDFVTERKKRFVNIIFYNKKACLYN